MDHRERQLADALECSIPNGADEEENWRREMFGKVRILVVGKSGAGKSTLLRLVIGADGPQTMVDGQAGMQDIEREYEYNSEMGIPIVFHDSNGVDVNEKAEPVKDFLEKRQHSADFSEQVHVVWYVVSAGDNRLMMDDGLLGVVSAFKTPVLLIMTHTDIIRETVIQARERTLCELIDTSVNDPHTRQFMKRSILRVGNDATFDPEDNRIDIGHLDVEGLKRVSSWTSDLLQSEKMKATWAASQAVDIKQKLELSAETIAGIMQKASWSSPATMVPLVDTIYITALFNKIFWSLCTIWGVPKSLTEVLSAKLLRKECTDSVVDKLGSDAVTMGAIGVAALTTIATAGLALIAVLPPVCAVIIGAGVSDARSVTISVKAFALQLLAGILYVKCRQMSKHKWDPSLSKIRCQALCDDFLKKGDLLTEIKQFAHTSHNTLDTMFRKQIVKDVLECKLIRFSSDILYHIDRPTSFASVLNIRNLR